MATKKQMSTSKIVENAVTEECWNDMNRYSKRAQRDKAESIANSIKANDVKWWAIRQMAAFGRTFKYSEMTVSFARRVAVNAMTGCFDIDSIVK